jgi:hypothetical protein
MSDPYVGPVSPGPFTGGPDANIRGEQARTNTSPGGSDLPSSIAAGVAAGLRGLEGVIARLDTQQQQTNLFLSMMTGKATQGGTMFGGTWGPMGVGSTTHTTGRGTVPTITARFDVGGGAFVERPDPTSLRGQPGQLPSRAMTMGNLRTRAARAISTSGSGIFGPRLETYENPVTKEIETHELIRDSDGNITTKRVDPKDVPKMQTRERVLGTFQGALGRAVAGEGIGGVGQIASALLPEAALPGVGVALAGGAVAMEGIRMVQNQRAQNAQYQAILGGSNISQFGQRAQALGFGLTNMFSFGGGQAQEAFMGATRLGMRGGERTAALHMAVSAFNSMGMSVAQSLQAMSIQAQSGYENFSDLEKSLKAVTQAAKDTSQNADQVRQSFISVYGSMVGQIGGGAGVQQAAQGIATMQTGLGRQFANVNFAGMTDQQRMYQMAAEQGMGYNQFVQKTLASPGFLNQAINKNINQFMTATGGGAANDAINAALKTGQYQSATGKLSPGQITNLTTQVMNQLPPIPQLRSVMQGALGIDTSNMSDQMVAEAYVNWQANQLRLPAGGPAGPQNISADQRRALATAGQPVPGQPNQPGDPTGVFALGAAAKGKGIKGGTTIDVGTIAGGGSHAALRQAYLRQVGRSTAATGQNSQVIDKMLKDNQSWSRLYTVQTAQGAKTVNFQDLITNYADQAASGGVTIASGSDQNGDLSGTTVAAKYGGDVNTALQQGFNAPSAKEGFKGKDRSEDIKKQRASGKEKQVLQISATPQLQQLLSFALNGQSVTSTTATSLVPSLGPVNPESLPGSAPSNYSGV